MVVDAHGGASDVTYDSLLRPLVVRTPDSLNLPQTVDTFSYRPAGHFDVTTHTHLRGTAPSVVSTSLSTPFGEAVASVGPPEGAGTTNAAFAMVAANITDAAGRPSALRSHAVPSALTAIQLALDPAQIRALSDTSPNTSYPLYDAWNRVVGVDQTTATSARAVFRKAYIDGGERVKGAAALARDGVLPGAMSSFTNDFSETLRDLRGRPVQSSYQPAVGFASEAETTTTSYNGFNEVVGTTRTVGSTVLYRQFLRDSSGRVVAVTEPHAVDGAATSSRTYAYRFDHIGRLLATRDPRGCGFNLHYDAYGRQIATDASPCTAEQNPYSAPNLVTGDGTEEFVEFAGGLDAAWTADEGLRTKYYRDSRGVVTATQVGLAAFAPNSALRPRFSDFRIKESWERDIDGALLVHSIFTPKTVGPSAENYEKFEYGGSGALIGVDSSFGMLASDFTYDIDGRVRGVTRGQSRELWQFDDFDRLINHGASSADGGLFNDWTYHDDADRVVLQVHDVDASMWPPTARPFDATYEYSPRGRLLAADRSYYGPSTGSAPNGIEMAAGNHAVAPHSTPSGRPLHERFVTSPDGSLAESTDSIDGAGAADTRLVSAVATADAPGQLLGSPQLAQKFDKAGNLVEQRVSHDGPCLVLGGNACFQLFRYTWDEFGRLSRVRRWDFTTVTALGAQPAYPTAPASTATSDVAFRYSGSARVLKAVTVGGTTTVELSPSSAVVVRGAEVTATGYSFAAENQELYLAGLAHVVDGLGGSAVGPRTLQMFADSRGSFVGAMDNVTGDTVEKRSYSAFGATDSDYRVPEYGYFRERIGFNGGTEDPETDLVHLGARYYHPYTGRFISLDPLTVHAAGADPNPYAFTHNDPVNFADPSGLAEDGTTIGPDGVPIFIGPNGEHKPADVEIKEDKIRGTPPPSEDPTSGAPPGGWLPMAAPTPALTHEELREAKGEQAKHALLDGGLPDTVHGMVDFGARMNRWWIGNSAASRIQATNDRVQRAITFGPPSNPALQATYEQQMRYSRGFYFGVSFLIPGAGATRGVAVAAEGVEAIEAIDAAAEGGEVLEAAISGGEAVAEELPVLPNSLGAAANITTKSRIYGNSYATRLAKSMSEAAQRDVDGLLSQFRAGNSSPGIGTRPLESGFYELRGANNGRVIVKRISAGTYEIVGKFQAHALAKAGNSNVIQRLIQSYNAL
jgi:RHS repeat-associated protein